MDTKLDLDTSMFLRQATLVTKRYRRLTALDSKRCPRQFALFPYGGKIMAS